MPSCSRILPSSARAREARGRAHRRATSAASREAELAGRIRYRTITNPRDFEQPLAPALMHFFNHQTHHRGQAHCLLTGLTGDRAFARPPSLSSARPALGSPERCRLPTLLPSRREIATVADRPAHFRVRWTPSHAKKMRPLKEGSRFRANGLGSKSPPCPAPSTTTSPSSQPWAYIGHAPFMDDRRAPRRRTSTTSRSFLGRVFAQTGGLPLAQRHPVRQRYRLVELQRWREKRGAVVQHPARSTGPSTSTLADRFVIAIDRGDTRIPIAFMRRAFAGVWEEERNLADPLVIAELAEAAGPRSRPRCCRSRRATMTEAIYALNLENAVAGRRLRLARPTCSTARCSGARTASSCSTTRWPAGGRPTASEQAVSAVRLASLGRDVLHSAATRLARHCARSARSAAGFSGLLRTCTLERARRSRTAGERSAVSENRRVARPRCAGAGARSPRGRCLRRGDSRR